MNVAPDPKSSAGISENPQGSVSDADLIRRFDVSKKSVEQVAEKEALENGVIDIVVKLKRESPELDLSRLTPEELLGKFAQSKIQWSSAEQIAIEKVEELMRTKTYKGLKFVAPEKLANELRQKFLPRVEERLKVAAAPLKVLKGQVDQKTAEAPEAPVVTPATAPLAEARAEVERKRLASQVGSPEKKGFEALPENLRQEADFIRSVAMLEIVPGLAKEGAGKSELSTLSNLPYLLDDFPKYMPSASAKRAIRQLQAVIENPDKDNFSKAVAKEWETFSMEGYQAAEIAFGNDFKKEGVTDSAMRFTKRSFQKHPVLSSAAVIAGAYGAYKLFSWIFGKKDEAEKKTDEKTEKKEGSFWGKAISFTVGGGALFLMGRYFWDDIKKWYKGAKGMAETVGTAQDAMDKAKNGNVIGATLSLLEGFSGINFENLEPRPQDQKAEEVVNGLLSHQTMDDGLQPTSAKAISVYRKIKLGSVSSVLKITDAQALLGSLGTKEYAGGFLKAVSDNPELSKEIGTFQRIALKAKKRKLIGISDDMTVEQVSELLVKNQEALKADFQKIAHKKGEGETDEEKSLRTAQNAAKETIESYTGLFFDIAHESLEQLPPKVREVIKKYKAGTESNDWGRKSVPEKISWVGQYALDVLRAVKSESGPNLLVSAAGIFLWVGPKETGKWVLIGSNKTVISAFWELATLNPMGAFESYMAGTTPFMIAGAGIGMLSKGPMGGLKGAWKGFKLPWTVVAKEYEIITQIGYYGKPDVIQRYASLGVFETESWARDKARFLTHWGKMAREERRLIREADRFIALKEHLSLVEKQLFDTNIPGKTNEALNDIKWELKEAIENLKTEFESAKAKNILQDRKVIRLERVFGENSMDAIHRILKDPKLEEVFLEHGHRSVVKALMESDRPEFFIKLLQGEEGKGLLKVIEDKNLLKNKKFIELMKEFDTLFGPKGEVDQKILAEIVRKAEQLELPAYERMLAKIQETIRTPLKMILASKGWKASAEWMAQRKAIQTTLQTFDQYVKAPIERAKVPIRKAIERFNDWRGPKFDQADLEYLAKERNPTKIKDFLKSKGIKGAERWSGELISETTSVDDVKYLIEETAKLEGKIVRYAPGIAKLSAMGRVLKYAKYAKPVLKGGFGVLAFAQAGFDFYEAKTTENQEKSGMLVEKGLGNTVLASIEVGIIYGAGAAAGAVGAAAGAALLPPAYMWNAGYESAMEKVKKPGEWAAEYDRETLVHQWLSTGIGTAGEAYHRAFTSANEKTYKESFRKTRREILGAILMTEGERFPKENEYRMTYFGKNLDFESPGFDYAKALEALHDSRLFAEAMAARENGMEHLGKLELSDVRFAPETINASDIVGVTVAYKLETKHFTHPALAKKFEKMSTGALVDLYWQLDKAFANPDNRENLSENEEAMRQELKHYLFYARHVEANAVLNSRYMKAIDEKIVARLGKLPKNVEELRKARQEALEAIKKEVDVGSVVAKAELLQNEGKEIPEEAVDDNAGCYALFKLAEVLGYDGQQTEIGLRGFFSENRADAFGVYWEDGEWRGNEGWWKDKGLGSTINENMVRAIIDHFRKNPKDVLGHRGESIALWGEGEEFEQQILNRAEILEKALKDYPNLSRPKESSEKVA